MLKSGTLILCFHRISDEFSPAYPPIPVKEFEKICSYAARRLMPISPYDKIKTKRRQVIFTFDDAYMDFYKYALPVLSKYKIPSVQHVITNCADTGESFWTQRLNKIIEAYYNQKVPLTFDDTKYKLESPQNVEQAALNIYSKLLEDSNRDQKIDFLEKPVQEFVSYTQMMKWDSLKDAASNNVIIGSHTVSHANLKEISEQEIDQELKESRAKIIQKLGNPHGQIIAYPNGQWNEKVSKMAQKTGYSMGYTTEARTYKSSDSNFAIPRLMLYHSNWLKNYIKIKLAVFK
jgi:peptidoglycan/xylan/chitin deacetylase (PgdA/CDA1 family)